MLITSGTQDDKERKHFFTALTNPWNYQGSSQVLLVSLSSIKNYQSKFDDTCIIKPSDNAHVFIKKDSFVDYSKSLLMAADDLNRGVSDGVIVERGTIDSVCFERIKSGLGSSLRTPQFIINAHHDYLNDTSD